jgi:hypothetical protein
MNSIPHEHFKAMVSQKYDRRAIQASPDLSPGDTHPSLVEVQNYLKHYGYLSQEVKCTPGQLDNVTVSALTEFQQHFNLTVLGTLDAATRSAMSASRCGLPDVGIDFMTIGAWNRRNLTYAFGNLSAQASNNVVRNAIRRAFDTWTAAGVGLTFTEVPQSQNHDIFIEWRQAADPDHSMVGGVLAHADFPPGFSVIVTSPPLPLHYDDQEHTWVDGNFINGFDIETVALHEIGHCLGMLHTDVAGSVMFPTVSPNFTLRTLQPDDLVGIRNLYSTGGWRLWNYDPGSTTDCLPGAPVGQGQWSSIRQGHLLVTMHDGRVLDWVPADGSWRLWNYDPGSTTDCLPGAPVGQGQWSSIRQGHLLVTMHDGRVLDWVPADGSWRLWNYDPGSTTDCLPGAPVGQGQWSSIRQGHLLVTMHDGRVLDWVP